MGEPTVDVHPPRALGAQLQREHEAEAPHELQAGSHRQEGAVGGPRAAAAEEAVEGQVELWRQGGGMGSGCRVGALCACALCFDGNGEGG